MLVPCLSLYIKYTRNRNYLSCTLSALILDQNEANGLRSLIDNGFLSVLPFATGRCHTSWRLDTPCIHFVLASEAGSLRKADRGARSTIESNHQSNIK